MYICIINAEKNQQTYMLNYPYSFLIYTLSTKCTCRTKTIIHNSKSRRTKEAIVSILRHRLFSLNNRTTRKCPIFCAFQIYSFYRTIYNSERRQQLTPRCRQSSTVTFFSFISNIDHLFQDQYP